jgi:hypothetical protein
MPKISTKTKKLSPIDPITLQMACIASPKKVKSAKIVELAYTEQPAVVKPKKRGRPANADANAYINNETFTRTMTEWVASIQGIKDRKKWPQMPNYVGECFMKIVDNYGNKSNFRNYTYLDMMKSEAILTCVKYAHNFNIEKSKNAFAYFTQVVHYCFLQILAKERLQNEIKFKAISEQSIYNYNSIDLYKPEDSE